MVEAVIVITFFVIAFVGLTYFRVLYTEKLRTQRIARAAALGHAMGACRGDPDAASAPEVGRRAVSTRTLEGVPFDVVPRGTGGGGDILGRARDKNQTAGADSVAEVSITGGAAASTQPGPAAADTGFSAKVATSSYVVCGDATPEDRYEGMVDAVLSAF